MNSSLALAATVFAVVLGLGAGYLGGTVNSATTTVTNFSIQTQTTSMTNTVTQSVTTTTTYSATVPSQENTGVQSLVILPDYGGDGYDAFMKASLFIATTPAHATNDTGPEPNNNNVTVSAGKPVKFIFINLDDMNLQNFTGKVTVPFAIYNNTEEGQFVVQYESGQTAPSLGMGHSFTIDALNIDVPIPPFTVVTFTYTFDKPGVYLYYCKTPCGPGMMAAGYMFGYIIVT